MENFLKEIDMLRIMPRRMVIKGGSGIHRGYGRGFSPDFYGHNAYTPGEDIRKIDWKAYARTENLYIKEFSEERRMQVSILLDVSASMDFRGPDKWGTARLLSIGLSYIALKQGERLNFFTVSDRLEVLRRNAEGTENFYELADRLEKLKPGGITDFTKFSEMNTGNPGMTFVISDFFSGDTEKAINLLCVEGQETVLVHTLSPSELSPCPGEELKLVDVETGEILRIHFTDRMKEKYKQKVREFIQNLEGMCALREVRYVKAATDQAPSKILQSVLGVYG